MRGITQDCVVIDALRAHCKGPVLRPYTMPFLSTRYRCVKYTVSITGSAGSHTAIGRRRESGMVNKCTVPKGKKDVIINWKFPIIAALIYGLGTLLCLSGVAWFLWQCVKYKPVDLPIVA